MKKFLYLISQNKNNGYDTYDSAVVCATSETQAATMHPGTGEPLGDEGCYSSWVPRIEDVIVRKIGKAEDNIEIGVVCASFNAG